MTNDVRVLLAAGWLVHFLSWAHAFARARGDAAQAGEWPREIVLRILIVALLAYSVFAPSSVTLALPAPVTGALVVCFWIGQLIVFRARLDLGLAWGIGTAPRSAVAAAVRGIYRYLHHPIYGGTCTAFIAQFLLLQNFASLLLVAGAVLVVPWKIKRENHALRPED